MVPVKVRAKGSNTLLSTYAFLDGGSNTIFCSDQLLKDLGVRVVDTTLSLTTMERENSIKASSLVQFEVFDLDENNFIELPLVFSTPELPISSEGEGSLKMLVRSANYPSRSLKILKDLGKKIEHP